MSEFNQLEPPKTITNPKGVANTEYPRHLHKWAGADDKGHPRMNEYIVVTSDDEKQQALADGWSLQPVTVDPSKKEFAKKHA